MELLGKEDNARINATINTKDVVLCALPYHDTHAFVRIVQLLSTSKKYQPSKPVVSFSTAVVVELLALLLDSFLLYSSSDDQCREALANFDN
ncbi:hypothetical protein AALP_AA2G004200 [Arabis alpina]|uniref:Uncharacterized protein n=1 Tax=Arabis alpina TaxID=50452 RepID=A0A087HEE9_ARAAL|nr:hypothetical protein AALP_AA2G004200 [Arabis alpina]